MGFTFDCPLFGWLYRPGGLGFKIRGIAAIT
jgi:hypothetical protein